MRARPIVFTGVVVIVLALFIASCARPTATPTPAPTSTPTSTPTPTFTPTPTATPSPTATPTPLPVLLKPQEARDLAIAFTVAPLPGLMSAEWDEEAVPHPLGRGEFRYTHDGWEVSVAYAIVANPDYDVSIVHQGLEIDWAGKVKSDGTVEGPTVDNILGLVPIMMITFTPSAVEGKVVTLVGEYRGWQPEGGGEPPVTRSDWVLNDGTGEIYVTGAAPDLDPVEDTGQMLTVTGIVKVTDGVLYLKAAEIQEGMYMGPE